MARACPACGRPNADTAARCLYCVAPLSAASTPVSVPAEAPPERHLLILLPSGEGDYEDIGESWRMAGVLGSKGIPNRVDPWGVEWRHDWTTWRAMLPRYLVELG